MMCTLILFLCLQAIQLPVESFDATHLRPYLNKHITLAAPVYIHNLNNFPRYGSFQVSREPRRYSYTELHKPGSDYLSDPKDTSLIIDDNSAKLYPKTSPFHPALDQGHLRVGNQVTQITGILSYQFGAFRLHMTKPPHILNLNPRPAPLARLPENRLRIVGINLHNFFNGDPKGNFKNNPRGARDRTAFSTQKQKIKAAWQYLKPDVAVLMEIENDGFGRDSALAELLSLANEASGARYEWVEAEQTGRDEIFSTLIYNPAKLKQSGKAIAIESGGRPALAQKFFHPAGNRHFSVVAVHLKSKIGCPESPSKDADQQDGQSCWNHTRTLASRHLLSQADPSQPVLILGDFNAYSQEDPVQVFIRAGWKSLLKTSNSQPYYSYVYQGRSGLLDHALANPAFVAFKPEAFTYPLNADEPPIPLRQRAAQTPFRFSDHDPVVVEM